MSSNQLTIAQALRRIKEIKGQVAKHSRNAQASVTHEAKQVPAYAFSAEWERATALVEEMIDLQASVTAANVHTTVDFEGKARTLSWCTKKLAEIKGAIAWHESLVVRTAEKTFEEEHEMTYGTAGAARIRVETEWTCHLPEAKRAERVQSLNDKFSALNDLVETMNHRTTV